MLDRKAINSFLVKTMDSLRAAMEEVDA